jgi:hypothetical protein
MARVTHGGPHRPDRGGMDPGVPQFATSWEITGFMLRGHTSDLEDQDAPIWVDPADTAICSGVMEGRCPSCVARPTIALGRDGSILILEHEDGCPWLDELAQRASQR